MCVFSTESTCRLSKEAFSLSSQSGPPSWSADTDEASGIGSVDVDAIIVVFLIAAQIRMRCSLRGRFVDPCHSYSFRLMRLMSD